MPKKYPKKPAKPKTNSIEAWRDYDKRVSEWQAKKKKIDKDRQELKRLKEKHRN